MDLHPMQRMRGYLVHTKPVEEVLTALTEALQTAELSLTCYGPTRYGKSAMLDALENRLTEKRSIAFLRSRIGSSREDNTTAKFWRRVRGGDISSDAYFVQNHPYQALINHIRNECDKLGTAVVLLGMDEAQNLNINELDLLKGLSEDLIKLGVRPFMLLVGQVELTLLIDWLRECSRQDLVQRFMLRQHVFRGLRSEDMPAFLKHVDTACWPEGSGITYTQHFAPDAWSAGWRMASQAGPLWGAFAAQAKSIGFESGDLEVGAAFVAQATLRTLQLVGADVKRRNAHAVFTEAVADSGFHESKRMGAKTADTGSPTARQMKKWLRASGR